MGEELGTSNGWRGPCWAQGQLRVPAARQVWEEARGDRPPGQGTCPRTIPQAPLSTGQAHRKWGHIRLGGPKGAILCSKTSSPTEAWPHPNCLRGRQCLGQGNPGAPLPRPEQTQGPPTPRVPRQKGVPSRLIGSCRKAQAGGPEVARWPGATWRPWVTPARTAAGASPSVELPQCVGGPRVSRPLLPGEGARLSVLGCMLGRGNRRGPCPCLPWKNAREGQVRLRVLGPVRLWVEGGRALGAGLVGVCGTEGGGRGLGGPGRLT